MSHDRSQSIDGSLTMTDSAIHTAYLLSFFDDLFDSVNGTARRNFSKPLRNVVTNESQHIHFWNKAIKFLQNIRFLDAIGRWANSPPLLKNWILTLQSFKLLHKKIRDMGYTNFSPRSFNQDPLGNYFGQIRMCGGRNISPSPTAFSHFFKGLLVKNFVSPHSLVFNTLIPLCAHKNVFAIINTIADRHLPSTTLTVQNIKLTLKGVR